MKKNNTKSVFPFGAILLPFCILLEILIIAFEFLRASLSGMSISPADALIYFDFEKIVCFSLWVCCQIFCFQSQCSCLRYG